MDNINATVLTVVPAVADIVVPLAVDEVEALLTVLGDLGSIVSDIEIAVMPLVQTVVDGKFSIYYPCRSPC